MASDGNKKGTGANEPDKDFMSHQNSAGDSDAMNVDWMIMSDFSTRIGAPTQLPTGQSSPVANPATAKALDLPRPSDDLEDDLEDIEWLQSLGLDEPVETYSKLTKTVTGNSQSAMPTQFNQSINQPNANPESNNIENIDWLIVSDLKTRIDDPEIKAKANPPVPTVQPSHSFTNPVLESSEDDFSFLDDPELADLDSLGFDTAESAEEQFPGEFASEFTNDFGTETSTNADLSDMDFLGELLQEGGDAPDVLSNDILNDLREIEELDTIGRSFIYENDEATGNEEVTGDFFGSDFDDQVADVLEDSGSSLAPNFEADLINGQKENEQNEQFDISEVEISDRASYQPELSDFQEDDLDGLIDNSLDSQGEEQLAIQPDNFTDESLGQDLEQDIYQDVQQDIYQDSGLAEQVFAEPVAADDWQVLSSGTDDDFAISLEANLDVDDAIWSSDSSISPEAISPSDFADVFADDWQPMSTQVPLDDGVWHSSDSPDAVAVSDTVINNAFDDSFEADNSSNVAAIAAASFDFSGSLTDTSDNFSDNSADSFTADFADEALINPSEFADFGESAEVSDHQDFVDVNLEANFEADIAQPMLEADNFEYSDQDLEAIIDSGSGTDWQDNLEADANLGSDADWQGNLEVDANLGLDADWQGNWQDNFESGSNLSSDDDWHNNLDSSEPLETQDYWQENLEADSANWENIAELEQNLEQELAQNWQSQDDIGYWADASVPENPPIAAIAPDLNVYGDVGVRLAIEDSSNPIDDYQDGYFPTQEQELENNFELEIDNNIESGLEDSLGNILDDDFDLAAFDEDSLPIVPIIYPSNISTTLTPPQKDSSAPSAVDAESNINEIDHNTQTKIEPIESVEFSHSANLDVNVLEPIDISIPAPSVLASPPPFIDNFDPIEEEIANNMLRDHQDSEADFIQEALNNDLLGNDLLSDDLLAGEMNHDYLDNFDLDNLDTQLPEDYSFTTPAISTGLSSPAIATAPMPPVAPLPTPPPVVVNPVNFYEEPSLSHTAATPLSPPSLPPLPPRRNPAQAPTPMPLPMQTKKPMERNVPVADSFDSFHESAGRSPNPRSAKDIDSLDQGWSELLDADTVLSGVLRSPISGGDTSISKHQRGGNSRAMPDTGSSRQAPPHQERGRSQRKKSAASGLPSFDELGLEVHDDNTDWSGLLDSGDLSDSITTISNANTPMSSRRVPPRSDMTIGGETREIPRDRRSSMPNFNEPPRARMDIPNDPMDFNRFTEDNYDPYQPVTPPPETPPQKPKITLPSISLEAMWQDYLKYPVIGLGAIGGAFLLYSLASRPIFDLGLRWGIFKDAKGMDFSKADFAGAKLENVDFSEAILTNAKFPDANLSGANLQNAKLDGADFKNANMSGARLINASVIWANFSNAQMNLVDLAGADITRSNFIGAKMNSANLKGTKIGAQGTDKATKLSPTVLLAWQIVNEPREGRNLSGQDLSALNLSFSTLKRANLTNTKLNFTDMTETDLSGANLSSAQVNGANWNGAKLNGINLTDVKFDKTKLPKTDEQTVCPNNRLGPCNF